VSTGLDLASVLLSTVIGLALGSFGGGGSILAVPVLVLVTHLGPTEAVGTSLAMVGTTSLLASYVHHRRGLVKLEVALVFGVSGVVTAFLGAKLTALVPSSVIMLALAALMLSVGVGMLSGKGRGVVPGMPSRSDRRLTASILAGAGVGLVTGFLGVGGGFLIVPALVAFAGLDMREAVGTSLLVIAINSAAGFIGHLDGGQLDARLIVVMTAPAVAGALVGERFARDISTLKLRRAFGLVVIFVGGALVLSAERVERARSALTHQPRAAVARVHRSLCHIALGSTRASAMIVKLVATHSEEHELTLEVVPCP
jgi:uncharacterized protein